MVSQYQKAKRFSSLHSDAGVFVVPNPWDVGSAKLLEGIGFKALATTSSGYAQSLGRMDGEVTLEEKLQHCEDLATSTNVPITADMENCFGDDPEDVAHCIRLVSKTGVIGASIEDFTGDRTNPIYDLSLTVERVAAAVEVARSLPFSFTITARAEQQLRAGYDLDETITRLKAYEKAGADVLYAPALRSLDEVRTVVKSLSTPLNVLGSALSTHSIIEIGEAGAKRVSVGGSLARLATKMLIEAGTSLFDSGSLTWASGMASSAEIRTLFEKLDR